MWICLYIALFLLDEVVSSWGGAVGVGPGAPEWVDCVQASETCSHDPQCSVRYRVMRQCLVGRERDMLDNPDCQEAMEVLLLSPLYDCRCKRAMKNELQCLQSYWTIHMGLNEGGDVYDTSPYEPVTPVRHPDALRLASIISGMHTVAPKPYQCADPTSKVCNPCLDATKACNLNNACKKQRSEYIMKCSKGEPCNRKRCHKALRQFLDRVPAEFSHRLLFCPCQEYACAERRRHTIVPNCSFEDKVKPNCLELRKTCRQDPLCRSRLADFHMNCQVTQHTVSSCPNEDNYQACLASYAGLIGTDMTPNYLDSKWTNWTVSPWCTCTGSGNQEEECESFLRYFTDNTCLRNAIQAFGYGAADTMFQKAASSTAATPTTRPGLEGMLGSSEPPYSANDTQLRQGHGRKCDLSEGYICEDPVMLEPSGGYDGLSRPEGSSEDGSASMRASVWVLVPSLTLATTLVVAHQGL